MKPIRCLAAALIAAAALSAPALSKSSGGFSGSSRSSFSARTSPHSPFSGAREESRSSGGFSGAAVRKETPSSGGFSAAPRSATSVPASPAAAPKPSAYDLHVNREMSAKAAETRASPAFRAAVGGRTFTTDQIRASRDAYWRTASRDRYVYLPRPYERQSYGSFSSGFLWGMILNAAFAHNHADDPAYRQWREDAEARAQSDARVREQLDELDRRVAEMDGQPRDPDYIPEGVPPEVVYSDEVLTGGARSGHHWLAWLAALAVAGALAAFVVVFLKNNRRRTA